MSPHTRGAAAVVLTSASLLLLVGAGGAQAALSHRADPAGDVKAASSASQAQRDTVDITLVSYDVRDERLVVTTTFGGLDRTPGRQFVTTEVGLGGSVLELTSKVDTSKVHVLTDDGARTCHGTDAYTDYDHHRVVQYVPVSCIDADVVRLRTTSVLVNKAGKLIAKDGARRSGDVYLTPRG